MAFGVSRPTRTTHPDSSEVGRLLTAGWTHSLGRPGHGSRQLYDPRLHVRHRIPRARGSPLLRTRPGGTRRAGGQPTARAMARQPRSGHRGPTVRPRSGKRLADVQAGRGVSRPTPAAVAQHTGPTCRPPGAQSRLPGPLTRTEPAGPPSTPPRAFDRPGPAVTSDKMFPATTRSRGPAQHPSAQTLARPGPRPAPNKYHTCTSTGPSRLQPAADPRAELAVARSQQKLSPQIGALPLHLTCTSNVGVTSTACKFSILACKFSTLGFVYLSG